MFPFKPKGNSPQMPSIINLTLIEYCKIIFSSNIFVFNKVIYRHRCLHTILAYNNAC